MDRSSKFLMALIAAGLWMNVMVGFIKAAKSDDTSDIAHSLKEIEHDVHTIYSGVCINHKIC